MVNPFIARSRDYPRLHKRRHRLKFSLREKACYLKLAKLGCSQNVIARFFHRSPSVVNRVLKHHGIADLRKLPRQIRELRAVFNIKRLEREGLGWLSFSLGEEDKPP